MQGGNMKVTLIQQTPDPIQTIADIASICYDSEPANPIKLVNHLYKNGHHSVFEHIYFTFKIEGISRACSHQLVRHRMCSFTQRSQRYCSEERFVAIEPKSIQSIDTKGGYWNLIDIISQHYEELQNIVPKEDARYVLPNACCTDLYLSCNLRELIHICNERLCSKAQWEIRELVEEMVSLVNPSLHFMLVPKCKSGRIICNTPCKTKEENK
jgi:thymidylate synthase (FAD)